MPTLVRAPADLVVASSDGIAIRFAGTRVGATDWQGTAGIEVSLEAIQGDETHHRDASFDQDLEAWAAKLASVGRGRAGDSPEMPGVPVLAAVQIALADDIGTAYSRITGQVAGTGTEWSARWFFSPLPPASATELHVTFTLHGRPAGPDCRIQLP